MKALITGINGFVGKHLEYFLKDRADVFGTSRIDHSERNIFKLCLLSEFDTVRLIEKVKPTHIFHLAGLSNVKESWENKEAFIQGNVIGTINLLEAVRKVDKNIRVITVGSSEEYGIVPKGIEKVHEEIPLSPINPYGISKSAISMLIKLYNKSYGLDVIHARPFNHIGPGQRLGFVTTDFAYQIAMINKRKTQGNRMSIGNLEAIRDFTDVRDIVEAYYQLGQYGEAGEIYNICTGKGISIQSILNTLLSFSTVDIEIVIDSQKIRVSDIQSLVGDPKKLSQLTAWKPKRTIENTLEDIYNYWMINL
ncbi:GDP-mannose 4,6-dehydratase [Priestia aryabhattai]|uniref:GDP-mannose 4,6-dehydratase n=1 Tax=Priestia TaxID=2800373 RepID=UPI001C8E2A48|nr:GDP-mannose 4,6-dehydratase [Priestia aryabhattai]MBY0074704.1 GDP-mannose 4,6-dehydratase [Priestia aryabhattai]